jgi:hypothetical protein
MIEFLFGVITLGVIFLIWFVAGLAKTSAKTKMLEDELDEWSGVTDVKREIDSKLNNSDERSGLRSRYNDDS